MTVEAEIRAFVEGLPRKGWALTWDGCICRRLADGLRGRCPLAFKIGGPTDFCSDKKAETGLRLSVTAVRCIRNAADGRARKSFARRLMLARFRLTEASR